MTQPFLGEIKMFAGTFVPNGYAFATGQLMAISQNIQLFAVLGTIYGGNGKNTFALPDLAGRAPMSWGDSPGTSTYEIGEEAGVTAVALDQTNMPVHSHDVQANFNIGDIAVPAPSESLCRASAGNGAFTDAVATNIEAMAAETIGAFSGGTSPHNNLQPYMTVNFIVALQGIIPSRG